MPPLDFPPPPGVSGTPVWTGDAFLAGGERRRVLAYGATPSGWTDRLTDLHEATAGTDHFMDVASRRLAVAEVTRTQPGGGHHLLEIGISSGYLLQDLRRACPRAMLVGADCVLGTLERAAAGLPGVPLLQFDLVECPLPDASFDTVILLNVLEHIERDDVAVRHLHRVLKPGGVAIIEVPAGPSLYDGYDRALRHARRYRMSALVRLVRDAGFSIERRSHLGFALYPGFWLAKKLQRALPRGAHDLDAGVRSSIAWSARFGAIAAGALSVEAALRPRVYLPFGIRCVVTCRKAGA